MNQVELAFAFILVAVISLGIGFVCGLGSYLLFF